MLRLVRLYFSTNFKYTHSIHSPLTISRLRTYLCNYALAKKKDGRLTIVLEDTRKQTKQANNQPKLVKLLQWLGAPPKIDEEPPEALIVVHQSQRIHQYKNMEKELVENKLAYPCFCSKERLNELTTKNSSKDKYDGHCRDIPVEASMKRIIANEPFCIRFRNELQHLKIDDGVYGELKHQKHENVDFIIADTENQPTPRFMRIVDSIEANLTHYISDYQNLKEVWYMVAVYRAFNIKLPQIIHLPRIKTTPVDKSTKVSWLKVQDYCPSAVVNTAMLLGWQPFGSSLQNQLEPEDDKFTLQEIISYLEIDKITKNDVIYRRHKLDELNKKYMKQELIEQDTLKSKLLVLSPKAQSLSKQKIIQIGQLIREGHLTGWRHLTQFKFLFEQPDLSSEEFKKNYQKLLTSEEGNKKSDIQSSTEEEKIKLNRTILQTLYRIFSQKIVAKDLTVEKAAIQISKLIQSKKIPNEQVYGLLRLAITGCHRSRSNFSILKACYILGGPEVASRIQRLL